MTNRVGRKADENAIYKTGSVIYIWVKQDIKDKIVALADLNGQTIAAVVRDILYKYFNQ